MAKHEEMARSFRVDCSIYASFDGARRRREKKKAERRFRTWGKLWTGK